MNIIALIVILLVGIFSDWENAACVLGGYLMAFLVIGLTNGKVMER